MRVSSNAGDATAWASETTLDRGVLHDYPSFFQVGSTLWLLYRNNKFASGAAIDPLDPDRLWFPKVVSGTFEMYQYRKSGGTWSGDATHVRLVAGSGLARGYQGVGRDHRRHVARHRLHRRHDVRTVGGHRVLAPTRHAAPPRSASAGRGLLSFSPKVRA